jgi:opacity protein-like surface antigen
MKKVLLVCMAALLLCAGNAFAAGMSVDVFGTWNSEVVDEFESAIGFGAGFNYDLSEKVTENLAARVDVSYAKWTWDFEFFTEDAEITITRIPIFLGARYNAPLEPVKVFGEAGLEVSMDKFEAAIPVTTLTGVWPNFAWTYDIETVEDSETNFGLAIGGGVAYPVNETISVGASARYHIVDEAYFSGGLFVGFAIGQ